MSKPTSWKVRRYDQIHEPISLKNMTQLSPVMIALKRPTGCEDVHGDLVMDEALRPGWPWSFVRDDGSAVVVAIDRPEGYERSAAKTLAKDAVKTTWPSWSVVAQ
ncbi:hypothetical protein [Acidovorax sp.]|uniref:hypothetical protein n=1 Tax=Acidovorax sp. TaxID=1872122 RepID=UPI00391FB201